MDLSTGTLFGVVLLLALNRAATLGGRVFARPRVFWAMQILNLAGACWMVLVGVPGFAGPLNIVNILLAGLLVLHILVNNRHYAAWLREQAEHSADEDARRRAALTERLSQGGQQDA